MVENIGIPLKDFITSTIKEIIESVNEIREYIKENKMDAKINPNSQQGVMQSQKRENLFFDKFTKRYGQMVDFNISVIANRGKDKKEGVGVNVVGIELFSNKKMNISESNINRINFQIPVMLPSHETQEEIKQLENEIKEQERKAKEEHHKERNKIDLEY